MGKVKVTLFNKFEGGRSILNEWVFDIGQEESTRVASGEKINLSYLSKEKFAVSFGKKSKLVLPGQVVNFLIKKHCFQVVFEPKEIFLFEPNV